MILPSGEQHELVLGDQRAVVVEVGGGLRIYERAGRPILLGYGEQEMCGAGRGQVLMPWPNRLAEGRYAWEGEELQLPLNEVESRSAIHGLVRWASWRAVEREEARVVVEHTLHPQPGYPFTLLLRVEYRLEERGLVVRTEAKNVGARTCPFGAGHHPYVAASEGVDELVLDGARIGARRLDETWHRPGGWRIAAADVELWADASWPYVQLFTGDLPDVGRRGLAIEPMTCPPQAFRTSEAVLRLSPGDTFFGEWGIDTRS